MKLELIDRLTLIDLLPQTGTIEQMRNYTALRSVLGLSDAEVADYKLSASNEESGTRITWDSSVDTSREFDIEPYVDTIKELIVELSNRKAVTDRILRLANLFNL